MLGNLFSVFCVFFTIGGVLDVVFPEKSKNIIGEYIFGFREIKFSEFEKRIIREFLSLFISKDNKLQKRKVFIFTIISMYLIVSAMFVTDYLPDGQISTYESWGHVIAAFFISPILLSFFTFIPDFWSVWVTKRIFLNGIFETTNVIKLIAIDVFITLIPSMLIFTLGYILAKNHIFYNDNNGGPGVILLLAAMSLSLTLIFHSIVQIVILSFGICIRGTILAFGINKYTVLISDIYKQPFTFLGIVSGLIVGLILALFNHLP